MSGSFRSASRCNPFRGPRIQMSRRRRHGTGRAEAGPVRTWPCDGRGEAMRIRIAVIGALLLLAGCQQAAEGPSETLAAAATDCTLKVGWDPWEPYQYQDAD